MLCTWRRKLTAAFVHEYAALAAPSTQIEMAAPSKRGGPLKTTTIDGAVLPVRREHSTQLTDVQLGGEGVETPDVETPSPPPSPPASSPPASPKAAAPATADEKAMAALGAAVEQANAQVA